MKSKIILFSIPNYNTVYMPLAIPCLTGYLRKNGFDVIQRDLNVLAYDFFLKEEYLQGCLQRAGLNNDKEYRQVISKVENAKKAMRDLRVYKNFNEFSRNKRILEKAFEIISKVSKEPLKIYGNTFEYRPKEYYEKGRKISYKSREGLLKSIRNKQDNIFYDFFRKQTIPFLKKEKPILIGISIFDQKQLVVAFILSSLIKEFRIYSKIILGGNVITRLYDILSKDNYLNRKLFNYIDCIVHHEGEIPVVEIAKRLLSKDVSFYNVPKLIYKDNGKIVENLDFNITDIREIPVPDFDGFNLGLHWTPQPIIDYLIKRGCSHRCNFCDTPFGYDGYYDIIENRTRKKFKVEGQSQKIRYLSPDRAIKEIKYLIDKYKSKYFSFADEELLSSFLKTFCEGLVDENIDIVWECFARMEPAFKEKRFCQLLSQAGCRFLQFGLESVSQKVLNYENKATKVSGYSLILENTYKAGIMNHIFILIGTPYDNLFEAIKILAFLEEYGKYIYTIRPIIYKVSKWSPNAFHASSKGLIVDEYNPDLDIHLETWKERPRYGMSIHQAKIFSKVLELWIRDRHKVNPVTRTYINAQRLFVGPKLIKEFSENVEPEEIPKHIKNDILKSFTDTLKEELENVKKEYRSFNPSNKTRKAELIRGSVYPYNSEDEKGLFFDRFFILLKSIKRPLTLDELIDFSKELQRIDNNVIN